MQFIFHLIITSHHRSAFHITFTFVSIFDFDSLAWTKMLLIGLLLGILCWLISLVVFPTTCENSCWHCGI